ncbi:MAG: class I SAM-dependent methyltransferase [Saprospiraceae bacterium]|nr:class I SAM-dependent methyltransferase [Saprospiraceae bacterium]
MYFHQIKNFPKNQRFKTQHPDFILPASPILYETFKLDYQKYFQSGQDAAIWILTQYKKHSNKPLQDLLDWGCGPARIVRHLPEIVPNEVKITASDFNSDTINWCAKHISGIRFIVNNLDPPLEGVNSSFDLIYGISIFTHLSKKRHQLWFTELNRLLNKDGLLLFTSHGQAFFKLLTDYEQKLFSQGNLIVRGHSKEGRRIFSTFHPPAFIQSILENNGFEVLEHISGSLDHNLPHQDIWIARKK